MHDGGRVLTESALMDPLNPLESKGDGYRARGAFHNGTNGSNASNGFYVSIVSVAASESCLGTGAVRAPVLMDSMDPLFDAGSLRDTSMALMALMALMDPKEPLRSLSRL